MEKQRHHFVAIIDLGSSSVGCSMVKVFKNKKDKDEKIRNEIVWSVRKRINFNEDVTFKTFFNYTTASLDEVVSLVKESEYKPKEIITFLSTPFFVSQSKTITENQEADRIITEKHIEKLTSQSVKTFLEKTPPLYSDIINDQNIILENYVLEVKLNGYQTEKPDGKKAKDLEISHYVSLTSKEITNRLTGTLKQINPKAEVSFISFLYGYTQIFPKLFPNKQSGLLLDISGELTDLIAISNGLISSHVSFPIGKNSIIRKTKVSLKTGTAPAESELALHSKKSLTQKTSDDLNQKLEPLKNEWNEKFKSALELIMKSTLLPETLYLIADDSVATIFNEWLETSDYSAYTLSDRNLSVNIISQDLFRSKINFDKNSKTDPTLLLESLFTTI